MQSQPRMRILMVSNLFPPDVLGGYELLAKDVAELLRDAGHEVHVLTTGRSRNDDPDWVHRRLSLIRPFDEPGSLDRFRHVAASGEQERALDEVVAEAGPFDAALIMSLRRLGLSVPRALAKHGIQAVYCFNDDWLLAHRTGVGASRIKRGIWSAVERGPLGARTWRGLRIDHAIYVSDSIRKALVDGGAPVPKGEVIWQGVDRRMFAPRPFRPVPQDAKLLYAGRVHPTKGIDVAIRALAELVSSRATLTIAGTGGDDELARLRALAQELGVASRVSFAGFIPRDELHRTYWDHDVFLFPSLWEEPAGLTYLEAMSAGVPVVGLARGGARELMRDQDNCLVVKDHWQMARAIERLIEDRSLAWRIVSGGDQTVSTQASLVRYVQGIEATLGRASRRAA